MSRIALNPAVIKELSAEYLVNGYNEVSALVGVGYSKYYAERAGKNIFKRPEIQAEITKQKLKLLLKSDITRESIIKEHNNLIELALAKGDLTAATANVIAKGKTIGLYQDSLNTNDLNRQAELKAISEQETIELRRIASIRLSEINGQAAGAGATGSEHSATNNELPTDQQDAGAEVNDDDELQSQAS